MQRVKKMAIKAMTAPRKTSMEMILWDGVWWKRGWFVWFVVVAVLYREYITILYYFIGIKMGEGKFLIPSELF